MACASLAQSRYGSRAVMATAVPTPRFNFVLLIPHAHEPMFVQALLARAAVEALDGGVVGWFAGSTEVNLDFALIGPATHRLGNELAAAVFLRPLALLSIRVRY
jgi:hypothetical protein